MIKKVAGEDTGYGSSPWLVSPPTTKWGTNISFLNSF